MKKIILILSLLFASATMSFAYTNGIGLMASTVPGMYPSSNSQVVSINSYCEIAFRCTYTNGGEPAYIPTSGAGYLKHGSTLIHDYNFGASTGAYQTFLGHWYAIEVGIVCYSNSIGLVEFMW
ncbi:hypothetical protein FAZ19_06565 [Sphingobacterium alkalisoli]|jgi:hypothetical protein|uniref:Uncharacterized protein n=1 Tax=Sphingobacterium alkalisoli TaxID=1874115 RepID=A0A4U0H4G5_9SPHI|nr:hypothetical protein [Sphingobacterium alkalisoli]TJY66581.1 hypothetical protein FAZ19_06565 [Sphingobacterium alkalisoli]GGH15532.1 hypothetical protein GCM10011418_17280 [Sphingobacterium alkalisoli]